MIADHAVALGHRVAGPRLHGPEPRPRRRGPATRLVDGDAETIGELPHRTVEIGLEIVVVHEHDVRRVAPRPRVGQVPRDPRQVVEVLPRVEVHLDPREQRLVQRRRRRRGGSGGALPGELGPAHAVEVELLVVERHRGVERMPRDHDVRDASVERDAVEGRVRLDESSVGLRVECGDDLVDAGGSSSRATARGRRSAPAVPASRTQQRADVLHPRRAVLGTRADDDVAVRGTRSRPSARCPRPTTCSGTGSPRRRAYRRAARGRPLRQFRLTEFGNKG